MADIQYWFDEYSKEVEQYEVVVNNLATLTDRSRIAQALTAGQAKINRLKDVKKSFGLELRLVKDRKSRSNFDQEAKTLEEKLPALHQLYAEAKTKHESAQLMQGSQNRGYSTEGRNNDELLGDADRMQDLTFESLGRTRNLIENSKEIGTLTMEEMRRQREQIIEIEKEVDALDSNLKRAEKLVVNFARRMATDKIIQLFATVNICVMLALILYVAVSGKSLANQAKSNPYVGPYLGSAPTRQPTMMPTQPPSHTPTTHPTLRPSTASPTMILPFLASPTSHPSCSPSARPTLRVPSITTSAPTFTPTQLLTVMPTELPTIVPTIMPTPAPTVDPTFIPTIMPTNLPTPAPTVVPTFTPTIMPTELPTIMPTNLPTPATTVVPTFTPTIMPTELPTIVPTIMPTPVPTVVPTFIPTIMPTDLPTPAPTVVPTFIPTIMPIDLNTSTNLII